MCSTKVNLGITLVKYTISLKCKQTKSKKVLEFRYRIFIGEYDKRKLNKTN